CIRVRPALVEGRPRASTGSARISRAGDGRERIDFAQGTRNCKPGDHSDRKGRRIGPLAPDLHEGGKTFVQRSSVLDQDRPSNDMIKVGIRLPKVTCRLLSACRAGPAKSSETTRPELSTPFWPPITIRSCPAGMRTACVKR